MNPYLEYQESDFKTLETETRIKEITKSIRINFIRKVYGILSFQILITTIFVILTMTIKSIKTFMINNPILFYIILLLTIILPIIIICFPNTMNKVPLNYIILLLFTLSESYLISFICSISNGKIVLMACLMTFFMVVFLSLYAFFTDNDITLKSSFLFIFAFSLFLFGFFLIFTNNKIIHIIYCVLGIILFSFYLVYDTQLIIGNKSYCVETDDYILASFMLYTDIISIFLELLNLLQLLNGE
jgi:FtsH-binding integral membrane protein